MTDATVLEIISGAMRISLVLGGPILAVTLAIGVVISLVQTVTQIQEMTLTFVPKVIAVAAVIMLLGSWMIEELINWVTRLWTQIPSFV